MIAPSIPGYSAPQAGPAPSPGAPSQPVQMTYQPMMAPQQQMQAPIALPFGVPGQVAPTAYQPAPLQAAPAHGAPQPGPTPQQAFDLTQWAVQNGVDVRQFGGPEGLLNTLLSKSVQALDLEDQLNSMRTAQQVQASGGDPEKAVNWKQFRNMMVEGPDGRLMPKPGLGHAVPWEAVEAANADVTRKREAIEGFLEDPAEFTWKQIQDRVAQMAEERFNALIANREHAITVDDWIQENQRVLYGNDGQPTQYAQRLYQIAEQIRSEEPGITPQKMFARAQRELEADMLREQFDLQVQMQTYQAQMQQVGQLFQNARQNPQMAAQINAMLATNPQAAAIASQAFGWQPQPMAPQMPQQMAIPGPMDTRGAPPQQTQHASPAPGQWPAAPAQSFHQPPNGTHPPQSFLEANRIPPGAWQTGSRDATTAGNTPPAPNTPFVERDAISIAESVAPQFGIDMP